MAEEALGSVRRRGPAGGVRQASYAKEWAAMQRQHGWADASKTAQNFYAALQQQRCVARRRSEESEEEELVFYSSSDGYAGAWFFRLLCPTHPARARRRVERVYWDGWSQLTHGMLLAGCGTILLAVGVGTTCLCEEPWRGVVLLVAALLLCIPGYYSLFLLLMYVRCCRGYTYTQLP